MQTLLGLSMTSSSVGWVLVEAGQSDGAVLDHDAFDVHIGPGVTAGSTSQRAAAAVLRLRAIAAASGHPVTSIGVTWSDDVDTEAALLLESLTDSGFDDVVAVRLPQASQAWARRIGRGAGVRIAVCVVEADTATVLVVDTGEGPVRTAVTHTRDSAADLIRWLTAVFDQDDWQPRKLFLVGERSDLYAIAWRLDEALPMPVVATADVQLALARGAALAAVQNIEVTDVHAGDGPGDDHPAHARSWLRSHARASIVMVCGVVTLVIALFVAGGPQLAQGKDSSPGYPRPAATTSRTPVSAQAATPPVSAPPATPLPPPPALPLPPQAPEPTATPPARDADPLPPPTIPISSPPTPQEPRDSLPAAPAPVTEVPSPPEPDPNPGILHGILGGLT